MPAMKNTKTRFAPSPTGLLHLGNARTALFNVLFGERFLLRIEDTDQERSRIEYVAALLEDLHWLGLHWHEGPRSATPDEHYYQSQRGKVYGRYYQQLEESGLAYPCFCTPKELELSRKAQRAAGQPPRYGGKCAHLSRAEIADKLAQGLKPTLRFRVPPDEIIEFVDLVRGAQRFHSADIGDFIIRRADGAASFFFCNAIDDALMGVTHVLRGEDHLTNTPRQMLLLRALHLPIPEYGHIAMVLGDDGTPLSKRNGSRSLKELREAGYLPLAVVNLLARLGHYYESDALMDLEALAQGFKVEALGRAPARFDSAQLTHWQREAVRASDDHALWNWLGGESQELAPSARRELFLELVRSNCTFPAEALEWARILFTDTLTLSPEMSAVARQAGTAYFQQALAAAKEFPNDYQRFIEALKKQTGAKGKALFQPLRASLTGRLDGPELGKIYALLDKEKVKVRLAEFAQ